MLTEDGGMACASSQNLNLSQKVSKPKSNKVRSITQGVRINLLRGAGQRR